MAIFEYLRRGNTESMAAISVAGVYEILPKPFCRECHYVTIVIPKFDINLGVQIVLVPSPARNHAAVGALDFGRIMRQWRGANAPGKNQQSEANKLEGNEDSHCPRNHTVAPIAVHLVPARKDVESGKQHRLIKSVNNVVKLRPVPEAHQSKREKIACDWSGFLMRKPFAAHRCIEEAHVNMVAKPK